MNKTKPNPTIVSIVPIQPKPSFDHDLEFRHGADLLFTGSAGFPLTNTEEIPPSSRKLWTIMTACILGIPFEQIKFELKTGGAA